MVASADRLLRRSILVVLGVVVFVMMTMTAIDVAGRYLLNSPLPGTQEATELMLALLVFGAAPLVAADRTHITADLFESMFRRRRRRVRDVSVSLISCGACAVLGWRIWAQAGAMAAMAGRTPLLGIPISPVLYFSAAMCAVCALITVAQALREAFSPWPA